MTEVEKKIKSLSKNPDFRIKMDNSKILKTIVETLAAIIDDVEMIITPELFTIKAMDSSRICILQLIIKKEDFKEFECTKDSKVGINLGDFDKILKRCSSEEDLILEFNRKNQKIKVQMQKEGASKVRTFSLALLDIDAEDMPMESLLNIDYTSYWVIDTDLLNEAIKDAEIYAEILNIKAEEKGLTFTASGQIGEMMYELDEEDLLEATLYGTNKGSYSIKYLKPLLKMAPITKELQVSLKTDHPLRMKFSIWEGGELDTFTAPRVEEETPDDDDYSDDDLT